MPKKPTTFENQFTDEPEKPKSKKSTKPVATTQKFITNPFFIATTGLEWMFARAKNIAIFIAVLSLLAFVSNLGPAPSSEPSQAQSTDLSWLTPEALMVIVPVILLVLLVVLAISLFLRALISYASAQVALGQTVGLKQAARAGLKRFWGITGLYLLMGIKILLWSLLFIIPGIIMSIRYSLAGVVYFAEEGTSPSQALKRSAALTKGSVLTVFGAKGLLNILSFGIVAELVDMGANTVLYRQLKDIETSGAETPKPHWLSWATLIFVIALFVLLTVLVILLGRALSKLNS